MPPTEADPERPGGQRPRRKILIVDDHPMLRRGLASLLESEPDLEVCWEVSTCAAALEVIHDHAPDLVIVDLMLDGCDGLDLVKDINVRHRRIPCLVLSMHDDSVYAERAFHAGARGYVTKNQLDDTVLLACRRVLDGELYLSPEFESQAARSFLAGKALPEATPLATLTERQQQVLRLIGEGRTTRQVAQMLHLSVKTIETHVEHLKQKLSIDSRVELTHQATLWVETGRLG